MEKNINLKSSSKKNEDNLEIFGLNIIKIIFILSLAIIIIILIFTKKINNLKKKLNISMTNLTYFYENKFKDLDHIYRVKLNNIINNYTELLTLYKENLTEFYIKGRQFIMELNGKYYNDSNILTIQDKLNWLIIHENPEYKTNIVDKILLREYSKKILGKDICVPILKIK